MQKAAQQEAVAPHRQDGKGRRRRKTEASLRGRQPRRAGPARAVPGKKPAIGLAHAQAALPGGQALKSQAPGATRSISCSKLALPSAR